MECRPTPTLAARRFAFDEADCLYRDHHGRRIVADCEGCGRFHIERGPVLVLTDVSGDSFRSGFTAWAEGRATVRLMDGPGADLPRGDEERIAVEGCWEGAGWVVEADGPFELDERREAAPAPIPEMPLPFWRSYRGAPARLVPRPLRARPVDAFSIADGEALKARGFRVQNMSDVADLDSCFDDGTPRRAPVASHLNTASWDVAVPEDATAMVLRKTYDRFHGRQRARVSVDGEPVGYWYEAGEHRRRRWSVSDFAIPATGPARTVRVSVDPVAGSPLWSVSEIEVWALALAR